MLSWLFVYICFVALSKMEWSAQDAVKEKDTMIFFHNLMVVSLELCQLGWWSQGVATWTTNSKIVHCHRETVNWDWVVCSFPTLFKKEAWEGRAERKQEDNTLPLSRIGYDKLTHRGWRGRATSERRESDRRQEGTNWKTLSLAFLSLILFLFPPHCFRGREETDKDRALNSDTGKHFSFFLFLLFRRWSRTISYVLRKRQSAPIFIHC